MRNKQAKTHLFNKKLKDVFFPRGGWLLMTYCGCAAPWAPSQGPVAAYPR